MAGRSTVIVLLGLKVCPRFASQQAQSVFMLQLKTVSNTFLILNSTKALQMLWVQITFLFKFSNYNPAPLSLESFYIKHRLMIKIAPTLTEGSKSAQLLWKMIWHYVL